MIYPGHTGKSHPKSPGATGSTDIVTYRYHGELVYVPLARDYHNAIEHVRSAFQELKGLPDASITLSLTSPDHAKKFVGISAPAWPKLIAHLARYQVIDVHATRFPIPNITVTYADAEEKEKEADEGNSEPAPPYSKDEKTSGEHEQVPRSPSAAPAPTLHRKRSWLFQKLH